MKIEDAMSLDSFQSLLETYGADDRRWPEADRAAAEALLAASPEARVLRDEAALLDSLLDRVPPVAPSPALRQAILAATIKAERTGLGQRIAQAWRSFWSELGHPVPVGLVLAAALALGVVLGVGGSNLTTATPNAGVDLVQFALAGDVYVETLQ